MADDTQDQDITPQDDAAAEADEQTTDTPETPAEAAPEESAGPTNIAADGMIAPADEEIEYGVDVSDAGTLKKKVTVTVPAKAIDAKRDEMFGELANTAQVPGFRIGRAPRRLIERRFGKEVGQDVRNAVLGDSLGKAITQSGLSVLGEPDLDIEAIELPEEGDLIYDFEVEIAPDFELPELEGIPLTRQPSEVTDERVDSVIDRERMRDVGYEKTDEPAEEQDQIDVVATIRGEDIDEQKSSATLRVAPGQVEGLPLVDLGEKVAGHKAGEKVELTVKVPEMHPNESWRGKELTVELDIQEVRRRVLPDVDDEYARNLGFESLAEMREEVAEMLRSRVEQEVQRDLRDQIRRYLLDKVEMDLPEGVAARHAERVLRRRLVELYQMGMPREQISEHMTEIQANIAEQSQSELKLAFILQKVADELDVDVTEEEVNARIAQMASAYNRRPERLRQELENEGALGQVATSLTEEKALEALLGKAAVTEASESADSGEGGEGPEAAEGSTDAESEDA